MVFDQLKAQMLLAECTGRDIWPSELCREKGVPEDWIEELARPFESGFRSPLQTIFVDDRLVNQFFGVHDLELAYRLGEYLGVDTAQATAFSLSPTAQVMAIRRAVEEL